MGNLFFNNEIFWLFFSNSLHSCITFLIERVDSLKDYTVRRIACGESHSLATNEWGEVFSWGSDSHGQLGIYVFFLN